MAKRRFALRFRGLTASLSSDPTFLALSLTHLQFLSLVSPSDLPLDTSLENAGTFCEKTIFYPTPYPSCPLSHVREREREIEMQAVLQTKGLLSFPSYPKPRPFSSPQPQGLRLRFQPLKPKPLDGFALP
ncbi:unnamed protein product [Thlaspi arvense]|uniref:Uncharacterized protein n=1 Tax=Thlaspi arvense TaxID=13288 RepID=A0AAU9RLM5_THLAR|nr:unnamed protein product [Thlaspi arvense]